MLMVRAPLRISLAGGGTDLPAYYEPHGGLVVSTTIDKFVHVQVRPNGADSAQVTSADYQTFYRHHCGTPANWDGHLALPAAVLRIFEIDRGIALFLASEVPPGTGLGSSSATAVALVQAIAAYRQQPLSRQEIAELACEIELIKLGAPIGKQDQFAAAYGGLNAISFDGTGVTVEPIEVPRDTLARLERRLLLFFTGTARDSATILKEQRRATADGNEQTVEALHQIKAAAVLCRRLLESGDLDGIGRLLDEGWRLKRQLVEGITNHAIDDLYDLALARGATGGKITGAGGGGFLLLYCHEAQQRGLTEAMEQRGLRRMDFRFERRGVASTTVDWDDETADEAERVAEPALISSLDG
ncbi:MAG TPA: hypothetical protein VNL16_19300, partial [Chloroflexota bacterium]|nr:hypothetical protein [Chloroflexota bacterium]